MQDREFSKFGRYYKTFRCKDCDINTSDIDEYYTLWNELWWKVTGHYKKFNEIKFYDFCNSREDYMLCIGCVENRLGRKLKPKDFPSNPLNKQNKKGYPNSSARLYKRITGK